MSNEPILIRVPIDRIEVGGKGSLGTMISKPLIPFNQEMKAELFRITADFTDDPNGIGGGDLVIKAELQVKPMNSLSRRQLTERITNVLVDNFEYIVKGESADVV